MNFQVRCSDEDLVSEFHQGQQAYRLHQQAGYKTATLRAGVHAGRRHVATLMRRMGIEALAPQPGTSKTQPGHKIYPYLLRKLAIIRANQAWALDTTYIPMARGFVYLTAVVDVASRRTLAHKVAITLEACHAKESRLPK